MAFSLFNKNWKSYLKRGERVLVHAGVMPIVCVAEIAKIFFLMTVVCIASWFFVEYKLTFWLFILPLVLLIFVLWAVVLIMQYMSVQFVFTDSGIYRIAGVIAKDVKYVPYKKITDIQIQRTFVDHLVGVGSVGVSTASGGNVVNGRQLNELTILGVTQYKEISELILKKIK